MHIAVLMGGVSSEREISVLSSFEITKALRALGHKVTVIEMTEGVLSQEQEKNWFSVVAGQIPPIEKKKKEIPMNQLLGDLSSLDKVFIGLHGGRGENGTVQAELEALGIAFTGSGSKACRLAMNKQETKIRYHEHGLPTPRWQVVKSNEEINLAYPFIVKPNQEGSSVGIRLVADRREQSQAFEIASSYDHEVLVEDYIEGSEYTVGVLGKDALIPGGIYPKESKLFDYTAKYQANLTDEVFPPKELSHDELSYLQQLALQAHSILGLSGYSRTDFIRDRTGNFFLLETNTLPGLTQQSLLPQAALATGISFLNMIKLILK
ncbi:MAG: D-alanine--D-alanine ligase [Betaproteobacteria bacterium]